MNQTRVVSTEALDTDICSAWSVLRSVRLHSIGALAAPRYGETGEYTDPSRAATAVFDRALDAMSELRKLHLNSRHDFINVVEVGLVLTEVQLRHQLQDEACDLLATLMRYAVSAGLMQTLVDCGDGVGELIAKLGRGEMSSRSSDAHSVRAYARLIDARRKLARRALQRDERVDPNSTARRGSISTTSLSDRESLIVGLMGQGMTNKQIAMHLRIAPETVKSHAKRLFMKLSAKNRAEAVTVASRLGLAQPSANRSALAVASAAPAA